MKRYGNVNFSGWLNIAAPLTTGNIIGDIVNNAVLIFNRSNAQTYQGVISGSGQVILAAADQLGTLILAGDNTYIGGTTINSGGGTLIIGDGGISGSVVGDIANNDRLVFNRSNAVIYNGVISGTGLVTQAGSGILILAGNNTYSGETRINSGTLALNATGSLASSSEVIMNGGTLDISGTAINKTIKTLFGDAGSRIALGANSLTFGATSNSSYAGSITGTGGLIKQGSGEFSLIGNSSAFQGGTTVTNGALRLNGVLGGDLQIDASGRLAGTGTIRNNLLVKGAIAPGNSIGTLNIGGNYTQTTGSIYEAEINPQGQSDLINVAGSATIQGGTVQVIKAPGTYLSGTRYTLLTAASSVNGKYNTLSQTMPFLDLVLNYDSNHVYLDVLRNTTPFASLAVTPNQTSVANALASLGAGNALYDAIVSLPNAASVDLAFNSLSGEIHASLLSVLTQDSFYIRNAVLNRLSDSWAKGKNVLDKDGFSAEEEGIWAQGFGARGDLDGSVNAARVNHSAKGLFLGADKHVPYGVRAGVVAGISQSNFDVAARRSEGLSHNYHLGIYGSTSVQRVALRVGGAYTWHAMNTQRYVLFLGVASALRSNYDGSTAQAFAEGGLPLQIKTISTEPFAQLAYVGVDTNNFHEHGALAGLAGAKARANTVWDTRARACLSSR